MRASRAIFLSSKQAEGLKRVFLVCFIEELVETRLGEEGLSIQFRAKLAGHDAGSEHVEFVFYLVDTGSKADFACYASHQSCFLN